MRNWQFLAAAEQGTTDFRDMLYNLSVRHVAMGTPPVLSLGEGDFSFFWRGLTTTGNGSGNIQAIFSKMPSGSSGSGIYLYFDGATKNAIIRINGVQVIYQATHAYVSGTPFIYVFGRRNGVYEMWVDGQKQSLTLIGEAHASGNFDNSINARLMQAASGNPALVGFTSRFGVLKGRMLDADEVAGLELDIMPADLQPLYHFNALGGVVVEDTSSLGLNGTVSGWAQADTDEATHIVWYRGNSTFLFPPFSSLQSKVMERGYTFTRAISSANTTYHYTVRDVSGNALASGQFTTASSRAAVSFSVAAGQTLEISMPATSSAGRALCFL
jgi:hypothetical protein